MYMCHESHAQLIFTSFLGADEDIESSELTTSRLIPKISFTSAAPKVETMTLKTQSITPAQTKVHLLGIALACTWEYSFLLTTQSSSFERPHLKLYRGKQSFYPIAGDGSLLFNNMFRLTCLLFLPPRPVFLMNILFFNMMLFLMELR